MSKEYNGLCSYGCGAKIKFKFKSKEGGCCSKYWMQCPAMKEKHSNSLSKRYENTPRGQAKKELKSGKGKCYICGKPAKYIVAKNSLCCESYARNCPGYSNYASERQKQTYRDNPEFLEWQRENVKDPKRSIAKSKTMLDKWENDNEFINKTLKAQKKRSRDHLKKILKKGADNYQQAHQIARKMFRDDACQKCGITNYQHNKVYGYNLELHCMTKDWSEMKKYNWTTLCVICHRRLEHEIRNARKENRKVNINISIDM